jgi:hypothetical protein
LLLNHFGSKIVEHRNGKQVQVGTRCLCVEGHWEDWIQIHTAGRQDIQKPEGTAQTQLTQKAVDRVADDVHDSRDVVGRQDSFDQCSMEVQLLLSEMRKQRGVDNWHEPNMKENAPQSQDKVEQDWDHRQRSDNKHSAMTL